MLRYGRKSIPLSRHLINNSFTRKPSDQINLVHSSISGRDVLDQYGQLLNHHSFFIDHRVTWSVFCWVGVQMSGVELTDNVMLEISFWNNLISNTKICKTMIMNHVVISYAYRLPKCWITNFWYISWCSINMQFECNLINIEFVLIRLNIFLGHYF